MKKSIIAAVAVLALLSAFLAAPKAQAQTYISGGVSQAFVVAPGGGYGSSVWATLNGGLVYLTCPEGYCNAGDVITVISTQPGGQPGTTYAIVQTTAAVSIAPAYSSYAAPVTYSAPLTTYATPVYPASYGYGLGTGYGGFGSGFGGFGGCMFGCFGHGFGSGFGSGHNHGGCPAGTHWDKATHMCS